jgi:hypothetical protein
MSTAPSRYRVFRVAPSTDPTVLIPVIGDFPDYAIAVRARDEDILQQLADNSWTYRTMAYWFHWRGPLGESEEWTTVTAAGVDPDRPEPPGMADAEDVRNWLAAIHGWQP